MFNYIFSSYYQLVEIIHILSELIKMRSRVYKSAMCVGFRMTAYLYRKFGDTVQLQFNLERMFDIQIRVNGAFLSVMHILCLSVCALMSEK